MTTFAKGPPAKTPLRVPKWQTVVTVGSLVAIGLYLSAGYWTAWGDLRDIAIPWLHAHLAVKLTPLLLIIAVGGVPLVVQIAAKLVRGDWGADLLAAISLVAAVLLSEYLAAVLIILMLAGGQALEGYAIRRASSVLRLLSARMPAKAHRKLNDRIDDIDIGEIRIGDQIIIYPHETVPVDGVVVEGHSAMDESYLTGEPYLVSKAPGVAVLSGAINGEAALTITADKAPQDSRYAKIMEVMRDAEQKRPRLRRLGDRLGGVFAIFTLVASGAVWLITGDALRFLAVIMIATPCPLLIAIPITIIGAISLSARRGIVIKDPTVLERLPTCRTAIFDKTGTLTYGRPELVEVAPTAGLTREELLQLAASLERYSKHPLGAAILKAGLSEQLALLDVDRVSEKPGQGLTGHVDQKEVRVTGRGKLPEALAAELPPAQPGMECVVLVDSRLAGVLRFRDVLRAEGRPFITHLAPRHQFDRIMLVSGDRLSEVEHLAGLVGIKEAYASQSPEQKVALVREEAAKAPTLFMGDGINDAPALQVATVGIAFGQQSITAEAAGAVILENTLAKVDELLHISIRLRHIALQSAIGGMLLSIVGMGFAAFGLVTPVESALLQEGIDGLAILNALRLTLQTRIGSDLEG